MDEKLATRIPDALQPISWLEGKWSTKEGRGKYPTLPEFLFCEQLEFVCIGQPMFNFSSVSHNPVSNKPMHQERGFLRINPGTNQIALVASHNFGVTSVEEGIVDFDNRLITLESINIGRITTARSPKVTKFKRELKMLDENTLQIVMYMETETTPMTEHLRSVYRREGPTA